MRLSVIALVVCLYTLTQCGRLGAQEGVPLGPQPLDSLGSPAAEPDEALPLDGAAPNPFRDFNAPAFQEGQPGFAEATDQGVLGQNQPSNRPPTTRPNSNRRPSAAPASTSSSSSRNNDSFSPRLARAAPIMGDSLSPSLQFVDPFDHTVAQIPTGGSATRRKIGENSGAFPTDRIIFNYNNFQNALDSVSDSVNIDRFTLGAEKTFFDGMCSIDVRLPLSGKNDYVDPMGAFRRNGSELGNVSAALKVLLTSNDDMALSAGVVVDTPTGSSTTALLANGANLKFNNEAVHLAPFLGVLFLQGDDVTHQAFIQVDVATNPNGFTYSEASVVSTEFEEQTLLYADYSVSKALYQAGSGQEVLERVSGLVEFHYTTTLEDSDEIQIGSPNTTFNLTSQGNRIDVLNLTLGVDTLLSCGANLRFGTVLPLTDGDDRFFDVEFLAQLNFPL